MPYPWIRFFHILSSIAFVGIHGASIVVLYAIRNERDRARIESMLSLSAKTVTTMYGALAAVIGTGLWLGIVVTGWFRQPWYWLSLALLVATTVVMYFVAKPFGEHLRAACEVRPSGLPRVSDEELAQILRSPRTHIITAIGIAALVAILYLMVFKPAF